MPARSPHSLGVISINTILVVSLAILAIVTLMILINPPGKQAQARDDQRRLDLAAIQQALERYAGNHNGQYPTTIQVSASYDTLDHYQPQCFQCGIDEYQHNNITGISFTRDNWIPELVDQGYLPNLPLDPQTGDQTAGLCAASGWPRGYIYVSNGQDYKVFDFCGPRSQLNFSVGAVSPYCVGPDRDVLLPNPNGQPRLAPLADPKQPSFHYAIYSPGWACK